MDNRGNRRFSTRRTADRPDSPIFEDRSVARRGKPDARAAERVAADRVAADRKDAERADDDGMASPGPPGRQ